MKSETNVQAQISSLYPETYEDFVQNLDKMIELFCEKQLDYGPENVCVFGNTIDSSNIDISKTYLILEMNNKVSRLKNLVLKDQDPKNESVIDTVMDLAIYCNMFLIVNNKKWGR